ncbi:MAG: alpha/beta fold hydrolase [Bryobacteraceae bacterium]|jgi:homoserine O-acetyltransferase
MRSVLLLLLLPSAFAAAPPLQTASLGDLKLESGEVLRNCRIGYRTFGSLNAAKSNAVLFPTWFSGRSDDLAQFMAADGLVNPARYFAIAVDALGDGVSSSPSNSAEQPRMRFPKFTIRDMVTAEYRLVKEVLGIPRLHAVMGISMGGMQTFQWVLSYPDFVERAVPIVGSPRLTSTDLLLWTAEADAITESAGWNGGNYQNMPSLRSVGEMHAFALTTPAYRARSTPADDFPAFLKGIDDAPLGRTDAGDWLRQLQAMMSLDVSKPFGESLARAARTVKAKVLIVVAKQDHMVNPLSALEFAAAIGAPIIQLESDCGHLSPGCEKDTLYPRVRAFLDQ